MYTYEAGRLGNMVLTGSRDHSLSQAKYPPMQPAAGFIHLPSEYGHLAKEAPLYIKLIIAFLFDSCDNQIRNPKRYHRTSSVLVNNISVERMLELHHLLGPFGFQMWKL